MANYSRVIVSRNEEAIVQNVFFDEKERKSFTIKNVFGNELLILSGMDTMPVPE